MDSYDLLVIGAGPGGYVAAIRGAQLGLRTACVDQWIGKSGKPTLGGTCLNVGCIPSKALLDSSEHFHRARHELAGHGISVGEPELDVAAMIARKDGIVGRLTGGIAGLFRKNKVAWLQGRAELAGGGRVRVHDHGGDTAEVEARHIVIATGSVPTAIPVAPVDGERIVDSAGALEFGEVPQRLGVIGAGVIGLELGSVWGRLGAEVTLLEALPDFLPAADAEIAAQAQKSLAAQGLDIRLGARVTEAVAGKAGVEVRYEQDGDTRQLEVDRLIVAVGRRPFTGDLGLEAAGVACDERGFVEVDEHFRTAAEGIYAIGDVVPGPMLAHKASEEGVAVAELIATGTGHVDHALIPSVIYTWPEVAWVGRSARELDQAGVEYRSGSFPFMASGRAQAMDCTEGLVRIHADARSDRVLGVHIFGPGASELVAEAVVAMAYQASAEDIARIVHAHPTLSEAVHEAALAVDGRAIHI